MMCQLFLANRVERPRDEVLAVLEDGVHPGTRVVVDPTRWDSTPMPRFRVIHVPGVRASTFDHLMEHDPDDSAPTKRRLVLNLTPQRRADLSQSRVLTLRQEDIEHRLNPDGSGT